MSSFDTEELNNFLAKVDLVSNTIKELGNNDEQALKKADKIIKELQTENENNDNDKKNNKQNKEIENVRSNEYRKGDGFKTEYVCYCLNCSIEILIDSKICPKCQSKNIVL